MIREGSSVSYTGCDGDGLSLGDQGRVLSSSDGTTHVMWTSGLCEHQVTPVYDVDLVPLSLVSARSDPLEDSLELGGLMTFSVRQTFDEAGETGVLNQMAETGHLAVFADIADETLALVTSRVRRDASFMAVLAALEEDEAEAVIRMASICLVRDAFTLDED